MGILMIRLSTALTATMILALAPSAQALSFKGAERALRRLPQSGRDLVLHPFGQATQNGNVDPTQPAMALFQRGGLSFNEAVKTVLRSDFLNPMIEMRGTPVTGFGLATGGHSEDFRFYVGGVPLCGFQVRAHSLTGPKSQGGMFVLGSLPDVDPYEPVPASDWPDLGLTLDNVTKDTVELTGAKRLTLASRSRCLHVVDGRLLPVWNLKVYADGMPYVAWADAYETVKIERAFFDVDGTAKIYPHNRLDASLVDLKLKDLAADGTLSSTYLKTIVPPAYTPVSSTTHNYQIAPTDLRFDELQVYAQAQIHFDFFSSLGFEWYGPKPLEIKIHIEPDNRKNNALFIPGSDIDGSRPSISIHDGDGIDLQNLVSDGDVVSHEFGHHVIYRTLRSTSGESLVLHEGLADFFAFSRTGDACLGESICPQGSTACILESQCLRTADNGLVYDDELWNTWAGAKYRLGHLHGQLVSGMLWDLRTEQGIPAADVSKMTMKAVSYFKENSGLRDLMLALFTADLELFGAQYADKIYAAGTKRGLGGMFADVTPGQPIPALEGTNPALGGTAPTASTKKKEKEDNNPFKCATIAYDADRTSGIFLMLLLSIPLFFVLAPKPARAPARKKNR